MVYSADQRRRGINAFLIRTGLSAREVCKNGGLSPSALTQFLSSQTESMGDKTYEKLAHGAGVSLHREVTVPEFRGDLDMLEYPPLPARAPGSSIKIQCFVGAGDRVYFYNDSDPIEYIVAPVGFENGVSVIVKGESGRPLYEDGDVLFSKALEPPPKVETRRAVIAQVAEDELYLKKIIPGTKRGLYHLLSMNPTTPIMLDRSVIAIARVGVVILKS